jgi:lipopolysaccharide transport system permease protein
MIIENIRELYKTRELLWVWTLREIRARYKQSILGGIWAILQPLSLMLIFTAVFSYLAEIPSDGIPYPVFSYSALLPWTFFATSVSFGVNSLIGNMNLVTKIYFPREVLPFASIGASFLDYLIASSIFLVLLLYYQVPFQSTLLYLPMLLIIQIILTAGISLLVASTVVFFRDMRFIVPLGLQLWMYMTPIVYPLSLVPERFRLIYMLNPMASLIDGYRRITLLGQAPQWDYLVLGAGLSIALLWVSYFFFKKAESVFADII